MSSRRRGVDQQGLLAYYALEGVSFVLAASRRGRPLFDARSVLLVREHGTMARTSLVDLFNIPLISDRLLVILIILTAVRQRSRIKQPSPSLKRIGLLFVEERKAADILGCESVKALM